MVTLLAFDFWTVKNVSGRLLVGLRWWNKVVRLRFLATPLDTESWTHSSYGVAGRGGRVDGVGLRVKKGVRCRCACRGVTVGRLTDVLTASLG